MHIEQAPLEDLKPLNYESSPTLCLLTPHYTHTPLHPASLRGALKMPVAHLARSG